MSGKCYTVLYSHTDANGENEKECSYVSKKVPGTAPSLIKSWPKWDIRYRDDVYTVFPGYTKSCMATSKNLIAALKLALVQARAYRRGGYSHEKLRSIRLDGVDAR